MQLPALVPRQLLYLRLMNSSQELFNALKKKPEELLIFFEAACDDKTWCEAHPNFMQALLAFLTQKHLTGGLSNTFFASAAQIIRTSFDVLEKLIPNNLRFVLQEREFSTNTLLVAMSSDYFNALIHRQCRIGKKNILTLDEEALTSALFTAILEYIHRGNVENLWRKEAEFIMELHSAADHYGLDKLQNICVDIFKRYLTKDNVLQILLEAHEKGWKVLRGQCFDNVNGQEEMAIAFVHCPIDKLFFAFTECTATTREYFVFLAPYITHLICRAEIAQHPYMCEAVKAIPFLEGIDIKGSTSYPLFLDDTTINITYLNLSECDWLDDSILRQLSVAFPKIEELILERFLNSTNAWSFLRGWSHLLSLNLSDSYQLRDEELSIILQSCSSLEDLCLQNCQNLTDRGLKILAKQKADLIRLNLARTALQDETLIELAFRCPKLQELNISRCEKISERGIKEAVKHAKSLRSLQIERCSIALTAIAQLQKQYPRLTIIF